MRSLLQPHLPPLIKSIPVGAHSFDLTASRWLPKFQEADRLDLWTKIFGDSPIIRINRDRLLNFAYPTQEQKCAEILLWGYPGDQRGRVSGLLPSLARLSACAASNAPWPDYFDALDELRGMGISTISKFAYFYKRTIGSLQALILDDQLIAKTPLWQETAIARLARRSAREDFPEYLKAMHSAAKQIGCTPCQLELFLFVLGDNF